RSEISDKSDIAAPCNMFGHQFSSSPRKRHPQSLQDNDLQRSFVMQNCHLISMISPANPHHVHPDDLYCCSHYDGLDTDPLASPVTRTSACRGFSKPR
uniref:Uncharacterized protein n=1 Tax=Aegilops tauschii subsp. strangulata TaxID=200361 RepID=A0A453BAM6_AEGTS